jgi:hypothetical protein
MFLASAMATMRVDAASICAAEGLELTGTGGGAPAFSAGCLGTGGCECADGCFLPLPKPVIAAAFKATFA